MLFKTNLNLTLNHKRCDTGLLRGDLVRPMGCCGVDLAGSLQGVKGVWLKLVSLTTYYIE